MLKTAIQLRDFVMQHNPEGPPAEYGATHISTWYSRLNRKLKIPQVAVSEVCIVVPTFDDAGAIARQKADARSGLNQVDLGDIDHCVMQVEFQESLQVWR